MVVPLPQVAARFAEDLGSWRPARPAQADLAQEYRAFVAADPAASADRGLGRQHLTASAFVLSPDRSEVLLCFHRKGGFWVQLGGHIEPGDASVAAAALREAREESGLEALEPITERPVDLDRHDLGPGFARCDTHWDVGFAFTAPRSAVPRASDESEAVRWWPVAALPESVPPGFADRLRHAVDAVGAPAASTAMTVAELEAAVAPALHEILTADELAATSVRVVSVADPPRDLTAPEALDAWTQLRIETLGEVAAIWVDGSETAEAVRARVRSDLQDFVAESAFGWGQRRP